MEGPTSSWGSRNRTTCLTLQEHDDDYDDIYIYIWGTAVAQWLRCCDTNRKVAGSIPAGVIGIFHWQNPSDRTMVLVSTQPLKEMTTRSLSWGKSGQCLGLTTLPLSCADVMKSGKLNFLEPSGPLQACNGTVLLHLHIHLLIYTFIYICLFMAIFFFFRRWTSFNSWKLRPSQRHLSISLDPGRRLSNF